MTASISPMATALSGLMTASVYSATSRSCSAVAASAGRMAASAITAASTAMETAARAADEARDKAARRRDPKAAHQRSLKQARYTVNSWAATTSTSAVVAVGGGVVADEFEGLLVEGDRRGAQLEGAPHAGADRHDGDGQDEQRGDPDAGERRQRLGVEVVGVLVGEEHGGRAVGRLRPAR